MHALSVGQVGGDPRDLNPLSIFAASLSGPAPTWDTSVSSFFGSGTEKNPSEVEGNHLSETIARPNVPELSGDTLFAFRQAVTLRPGRSTTLRYVYGMAHPGQIAPLVAKYKAAPNAESASERTWRRYLPQGDFGSRYRWVSRELEWDAYLLRSSTVYEEGCGEHTITQGGYYQYGDGLNLGTRSWLHYILPILYSDPELAREILIYSIQFQPPGAAADAQLPYGTGHLLRADRSRHLGRPRLLAAERGHRVRPRDPGPCVLQAAGEVLRGVGTATVWDHLKIAFEHMESAISGRTATT